MVCKSYLKRFVFVLLVFVLIVAVGGLALYSQESPYISGLWLQKGVHYDGTICWTLVEIHSNLTESGVSGTGFASRASPMEIPTPDGGVMIVSEELRATWKMIARGEYKTKVLALLSSEGNVIGMVELTGILVKEAEDRMSATWNMRAIDFDGNELAQMPPMEATWTRISVD